MPPTKKEDFITMMNGRAEMANKYASLVDSYQYFLYKSEQISDKKKEEYNANNLKTAREDLDKFYSKHGPNINSMLADLFWSHKHMANQYLAMSDFEKANINKYSYRDFLSVFCRYNLIGSDRLTTALLNLGRLLKARSQALLEANKKLKSIEKFFALLDSSNDIDIEPGAGNGGGNVHTYARQTFESEGRDMLVGVCIAQEEFDETLRLIGMSEAELMGEERQPTTQELRAAMQVPPAQGQDRPMQTQGPATIQQVPGHLPEDSIAWTPETIGEVVAEIQAETPTPTLQEMI